MSLALAEQVAAIRAATTREAVGLIYADLVGYDCAQDDPDAGLEDLRGLALDYIRECCYEEGVHVADVGLDTVDDTARAFGPGRAAPAWWRE